MNRKGWLNRPKTTRRARSPAHNEPARPGGYEGRKDNNMKEENMTFSFDPSDFKGMLKLMDEKGNSNTMFLGSNESMEDTTISIFRDKIIYVTFQSNGWVRKNIYRRDGTTEETFDGRWNK